MRIERVEWPHLPVRQHRQHDQGGAGDQQDIRNLVRADRLSDEAMERIAGCQHDRDQHRKSPRQQRRSYGKRPKQRSGDEANFRGDAGVGCIAPAPTAQQGQRGHAQHHDRDHPLLRHQSCTTAQ